MNEMNTNTIAEHLPHQQSSGDSLSSFARLRTRKGYFVLLVVFPSLIMLAYLALFASPQYESRAEFIVRGIEPDAPQVGGIAEIVQGAGGGGAQRETISIRNYLTSHEAIEDLGEDGIDLVRVYHKDSVDFFSKLRFANPRAETLLEYYRDQVSIDYDPGDSSTRISVRAFEPEEAQAIAAALIVLGERRINTFNNRAIEAAEAAALADLDAAELELSQIQGELTRFRDLSGDLDPTAVSQATQQQLESVETELIRERSVLANMRSELDDSSPLVAAARSRVETLSRTVSEIRAKMAGDAGDISRRLAEYEELKLRQEFAAKRYDSARAELENANAQATRQQLFLVPVVNASMPERPVAPRPLRSSFALFLALAVIFAISWLLIAGIREHRAD